MLCQTDRMQLDWERIHRQHAKNKLAENRRMENVKRKASSVGESTQTHTNPFTQGSLRLSDYLYGLAVCTKTVYHT